MSVVDNEGLVRKMHFPRMVIPLSVVLTAAMNLVLSLLAVFVFLLAYGIPVRASWLGLGLIVVALVTFTAAVAMLLSSLYVRFRDVAPIWAVLSTVLFYGTPVIYAVEVVPAGWERCVLANPIAMLLEQARHWVVDPTAPAGDHRDRGLAVGAGAAGRVRRHMRAGAVGVQPRGAAHRRAAVAPPRPGQTRSLRGRILARPKHPPRIAGSTLQTQSGVWELVRRQHGVVARRQLLELGFDAKVVDRRVASGRLHVLRRGIYAVGRPHVDRRGWWLAAVLACGPRAVLSHWSAAVLWRMCRDAGLARVDVSVPDEVVRRRRGIDLHRRWNFSALDLSTCQGIPVASPICTLVDIAADLSPSPARGGRQRSRQTRLVRVRRAAHGC